MPGIVDRLFNEPEGYTAGSTRADRPASEGTANVLILLVIAVIAGIGAGFIGSTLGDDPTSVDAKLRQIEWQSQVTDAIRAGQPAPEPNWDNRPWAAKDPVLFGAAVAGGVFVIGLLVIIAANTSRRS